MEKTEKLTIGEVARAAGVAATTLRYYEREGLLSPTGRSRAGYRLYDEEAAERLEFIRAAQAVGFTLGDIRALLELNGDSPCRQVQALIERRLTDALERCRKSKKGCAVVADLKRNRRKRRSN